MTAGGTLIRSYLIFNQRYVATMAAIGTGILIYKYVKYVYDTTREINANLDMIKLNEEVNYMKEQLHIKED